MSNQPPSDDTREKKRAQFSGSSGQKTRVTPILAVTLIVLLGVAAYLVFSGGGDQPASTNVAAGDRGAPSNTDLRIPIADLSAGKAKFFDYKTADNKAIRFFVIRSSDGVYRAALDACDTCFHAKKGYHQEGDEMICNNCNLRFHSALINEVKGGCNPVGLPRTVEGDQVVIKTTELDKRSSYF